MSDIFFSKFDSEYFSLIIFLKYLFILLLIMISFIIMTLLEKNKICRTFRAVGHLGTLHTLEVFRERNFISTCAFVPILLFVCINDYMHCKKFEINMFKPK